MYVLASIKRLLIDQHVRWRLACGLRSETGAASNHSGKVTCAESPVFSFGQAEPCEGCEDKVRQPIESTEYARSQSLSASSPFPFQIDT